MGSGRARAYVPDVENLRKEIVKKFHEQEHFGVAKVYATVAQYLYWRRMYEDTPCWIPGCKGSFTNKGERRKTAGFAPPHDIPKRCLERITADFVTSFPTIDRGHNEILVVVDKVSKRVVLISMKTDIDMKMRLQTYLRLMYFPNLEYQTR